MSAEGNRARALAEDDEHRDDADGPRGPHDARIVQFAASIARQE